MAMVQKFISNFNLFDLFAHPYRDGVKKSEDEKWWWFDALHYLTHYCADTVGHPYVNLISGGPYRSHAQRHKTGENYQDVFNLLNATGTDWNRSKLHAFYNFNFDGTIDTDNDEPDPFTVLPDDLAQLIAKTINKVYQEDADAEPEYGPSIAAGDVNNAYRLYRTCRS